MKNLQNAIQTFLDQLVSEGKERGAQCAVYYKGELIADVSAGVTDPGGKTKVTGDTLFPAFSTGKGIEATVAHILVERGKVTYDTPIAKVWPEFAANGKGGITLRHALSHTAGLQGMPLGTSYAQLDSWEKMCQLMAAETPTSAPGEVYAYHAITYSWLVGEVCCRVTGKTFPQLLADEICGPLGIANEMFFGIPDVVESRVVLLEDKAEASEPLPHNATDLAIPPLVLPLHAWMNRADARRACIPASNGIMSAHAAAKHYAALLPGGVDGVELLPASRIKMAMEAQPRPKNLKPEDPLPGHRLGYGLGSSTSPHSFGHGGAGGSFAFADPDHHFAFGFVRNNFAHETPLAKLGELITDTLDL